MLQAEAIPSALHRWPTAILQADTKALAATFKFFDVLKADADFEAERDRHPRKIRPSLFESHVNIVARAFFRANAASLAKIKVKRVFARSRNRVDRIIWAIHEAVVAMKA